MELSGNTILITGGTSGIGLELAIQLSKRRNTVLVTGRDPQKLRKLQHTLPGVHSYQSDVSDPAAIVSLYQRVTNDFPDLNVLMNNAGMMRMLSLNGGHGVQDIGREIEINLLGPVRMVEQFLPFLTTKPHAAVINVSSGLAFVPLPSAPIYCATKAALHSYTPNLATDGLQIRAVTVTDACVSRNSSSKGDGFLTGEPLIIYNMRYPRLDIYSCFVGGSDAHAGVRAWITLIATHVRLRYPALFTSQSG